MPVPVQHPCQMAECTHSIRQARSLARSAAKADRAIVAQGNPFDLGLPADQEAAAVAAYAAALFRLMQQLPVVAE